MRKAAAAGAHCRGPRACAVQSVWPLKTLCPNPITERKGRHMKAELGLSDRLTPLADYWIWWSDGRQRWMLPYVAQAAYTCRFTAGVSTESCVFMNYLMSDEYELWEWDNTDESQMKRTRLWLGCLVLAIWPVSCVLTLIEALQKNVLMFTAGVLWVCCGCYMDTARNCTHRHIRSVAYRCTLQL